MSKKKIIILSISIFMLVTLTACAPGNPENDPGQVINDKIDKVKEDISNHISDSMKEAISEQIKELTESIESTLDPVLGKLRENMKNIYEAILLYFKINGELPTQETVQKFFEDKFSDMNIEYKISEDESKAYITYTGDNYDKEKVPDIIFDTNK